VGLAYKAYISFIPFIINKYNLNKVSLEVLETNTVAFNLYKKIGFITEGVKREEAFRNGIYINSILMSILKKEWYKNE
jgi:RimJ/RimL family protein N-acetyltransferase